MLGMCYPLPPPACYIHILIFWKRFNYEMKAIFKLAAVAFVMLWSYRVWTKTLRLEVKLLTQLFIMIGDSTVLLYQVKNADKVSFQLYFLL
jgi:hypothetical protein